MARAYISRGHGAWKTILCSVTEGAKSLAPSGHWPQLGLSLWLRGPEPRVALLNKRWLLWVCLPRCSHCCARGFLRCSVPQLEGVMSRLCWPQDLHMYTEVSLYREAGGVGLRACRQWLLGLPEHTGQQLPSRVSCLLHGSPGCRCSRGSCGVRDDAGTATPALALAVGSSKDHKCQINQERP